MYPCLYNHGQVPRRNYNPVNQRNEISVLCKNIQKLFLETHRPSQFELFSAIKKMNIIPILWNLCAIFALGKSLYLIHVLWGLPNFVTMGHWFLLFDCRREHWFLLFDCNRGEGGHWFCFLTTTGRKGCTDFCFLTAAGSTDFYFLTATGGKGGTDFCFLTDKRGTDFCFMNDFVHLGRGIRFHSDPLRVHLQWWARNS